MHKFVLASKSPRRSFLLEKWGYQFSVLSLEISEILDEKLNVEEQIKTLAREKAEVLVKSSKLNNLEPTLVLSADTVVILDKKVLGKPRDKTEAKSFLKQMSGRSHEVITGICFWDSLSGAYHTDFDLTKVYFRNLSETEIETYVQSGEPMDKAGAYGIQGVGLSFVEKYVGSFENVMGLPMQLVERMINMNGWVLAKR